MTRSEFDAFCGGLTGTTNVEQWGGSSVWKVGGKIFAMCSPWGAQGRELISFKCSDLAYDILTEQPGILPAPYLARAKWVQLQSDDALADEDIGAYIRTAHAIIADKLTRAQREALGLPLKAKPTGSAPA